MTVFYPRTEMNDADRRFAELCERYTDRLVGDLRHFGLSEADAKDVAQEALLRTWKHLPAIDPPAEWAYLRTTAYSVARNIHRNASALCRGGRAVGSLEAVGEIAAVDPFPDPEQRRIKAEEIARFRAAFDAAMAELSQKEREALILRGRGMKSKEIATLLGADDTAVRSRLARAAKHLRDRVGKPPAGVDWAELMGDDDDHQE